MFVCCILVSASARVAPTSQPFFGAYRVQFSRLLNKVENDEPNKEISIPAGLQHFTTVEKMTFNNVTFVVNVEAGIHSDTGQVYATFQSLDPVTGLPPAVSIGFLPPENGTGRGQGHISYVIKQKTGLTTGTEVLNVAEIVFDGQPPIATDLIDPHDPTKGTDPTKEAPITVWSGSFPSVTTGTTTGITPSSATLTGVVNPSGYSTTAQFEYGPTTAYGSTATVTLAPSNGTTPQNIGAAISGLQPGTTYHYRLNVTASGLATWYGADATFASEPMPPATLTLSITGDGTGSVNSDPSGLFVCTYPPQTGTCSTTQPYSTSLALLATATGESLFSGWDGDCGYCPDPSCAITLYNGMNCTANFTILPPVRIGAKFFQTMKAAYGAATAGTTIQSRGTTLAGDLTLNRDIFVKFAGGFDAGYENQTGHTILQGILTVINGSLEVDGIIIK
jgi:hypothetical protein